MPDGKVGVKHTNPTVSGTGWLHVAGNTVRLVDALRTPATSSETCYTGDHAIDASYLYICVAGNTWKRVALSSF